MSKLNDLKPIKVFRYFRDICSIPHGSGNMKQISNYCIDFAKRNSLEYYTDDANNVVIYKKGTYGYEDSEPIILQGHLDMVCQKTDDSDVDFATHGLNIFMDNNLIGAKDTTLGADNGIAVAMILAILEDNKIKHPPIEAVFTTDEEIGMLGALELDMSVLKSKLMINLDAEEDDTVTVSCAGGSEICAKLATDRKVEKGYKVSVSLKGLRGGHSGVEINNGRANASIIAGRIFCELNSEDYEIINLFGGDKANAITNSFYAELCVADYDSFKNKFLKISEKIKLEIQSREPEFYAEISLLENSQTEIKVFADNLKEDVIYILGCCPNGVMEMSYDISGLVETSLNLGVLKTDDEFVTFNFALRSNKMSALSTLETKLKKFISKTSATADLFGRYPAWEYNRNSSLQTIYRDVYRDYTGEEPKVESIHAGLECGVFSSQIDGIDCIAIGPQLYDVHTVNERLSISSTEKIYNILLSILQILK